MLLTDLHSNRRQYYSKLQVFTINLQIYTYMHTQTHTHTHYHPLCLSLPTTGFLKIKSSIKFSEFCQSGNHQQHQ